MYTARRMILIAAGAATTALLCLAAARNSYFPTDIAIARMVQAKLPQSPEWAGWVTGTADKPWCFVLLALTIIIGWAISGWRAALLSLPIFFGVWGLGVWLSPLVAQSRPSPDLIHVVGHPKGYAFPSIFGLIYVATFGYIGVLAATDLGGISRAVTLAIAAAALLIGAGARIELGAHWPSDIWTAYLMGFVWIGLLSPLSRTDGETRVHES
jgi:membrane-associated phospholipid phosphatase